MATGATSQIWQYMIDAMYKTTKYDLALFFICVKTNVGYSVVAGFVVQSETVYLKPWLSLRLGIPIGAPYTS